MIKINKSYLYQLLTDALYYSISKIIPGLAGLVSVIIFFRLIGAEEYGKYSLIFSYTNLIAAFSFGWLNQSILRYRSTYNSSVEIISPVLMGFIFGIVLVIIFVIIASIFQFPIFFSNYHIIFLALSIGIFNILKSFFQSEELPNKVILITSAQSLLMILFSMLLLKFYNNNSESLILGVSFGYLIPILPFTKLFRTNITAKQKNKKIKSFLNYGGPLSIWLGISLSLNFLDKYFIEYYFGSSLMGSYAGFSEFITRIFSIVIFPITLAVHPIIINKWNKNKNAIDSLINLLQASLIQVVIFIIMLIPLVILKDSFFYLIQIMIPELDNSMKEIMIPVFVGGFLWQLALVIHKPLEIEERTLIMVGCIMLSVIINLIGNIYFLPKFGIIATSYTLIISALIYIVFSILFSNLFGNFTKEIN
jgi:O-antigen/teichoic acid export membrane protein